MRKNPIATIISEQLKLQMELNGQHQFSFHSPHIKLLSNMFYFNTILSSHPKYRRYIESFEAVQTKSALEHITTIIINDNNNNQNYHYRGWNRTEYQELCKHSSGKCTEYKIDEFPFLFMG